MYILPGYVNWYEKDGVITISSGLKQTTVELDDVTIKEEFYDIIRKGGVSEITIPLTEFLHEHNLLLTRDEIDKELEPIYMTLDESLLITVMPTESCNFRCKYCYEDHRQSTMSDETVSQIIRFLTESAKDYKCILVNWFGGEPTLCMDIVMRISDVIKRLQKEYSFQYVANMTTNGYLLNEKRFKQLIKAGVYGFQITLDGWDHDKTRPHCDGTETLNVIIDQLKTISELPKEEYNYRIVLRRNVLLGDEDYTWYDYLNNLFGDDSRFTVLVRPVGNWGGECVNALPVMKKSEAEDSLGRHVEYLNGIKLSCENNRNEILCKTCYACYPHSMVFRSNGIIERCTVVLDHQRNRIGSTGGRNGTEIDTMAEARWQFSGLEDKCYSCDRLLTCFNLSCRKEEVINETSSSSCPKDYLNVY